MRLYEEILRKWVLEQLSLKKEILPEIKEAVEEKEAEEEDVPKKKTHRTRKGTKHEK